MNKRTLAYVVVFTFMIGIITGCGSTEPEVIARPELDQVKTICELATLECYYHNVARSEKLSGEGISHWGEKDRKFWIEYDGIVKVGIDMNAVDMKVDGNVVSVSLPDAKILDISIDTNSYNEDSIIESEDALINKNKITADDMTLAVNTAQAQMKEEAENNSTIMGNAKKRAKDMIESYIKNLGEVTGQNYEIRWVDK